MYRIYKICTLLLFINIILGLPTLRRYEDISDGQNRYLMNRLSGEEYPGVVYYGANSVPIQDYPYPVLRASGSENKPVVTYVAVPLNPQRGVLDTLQGYVNTAAGAVTSTVTNAASNVIPRPPYTVNVPDIFNRFVSGIRNGANYVSNAWQNRPAILRPGSSSVASPAVETLDDLQPETSHVVYYQRPSDVPIAIFNPQAPLAEKPPLRVIGFY